MTFLFKPSQIINVSEIMMRGKTGAPETLKQRKHTAVQAAITHPDTCGPIRGGEAARV